MTRGEKIKTVRERIGLSQTALADKINVSKQTMYKYESDVITNIPSDKIEAIAQICNCSPQYLMGWEEQPAAAPSSDGRAESKRFGYDKPLHQDADNGINGDKPLHVDESKSFYDTDRLLAEVRKYDTDTPEQRAALSAALDSMPIPDDKRELMKGVLELDPDQAAAFLAFAKTVVKRP